MHIYDPKVHKLVLAFLNSYYSQLCIHTVCTFICQSSKPFSLNRSFSKTMYITQKILRCVINQSIYLYIWSTSQQACHTTFVYYSRTRLLFAVINWSAHADRDCYCVGLGLQTCMYVYAVVDDIGRHNSYTVHYTLAVHTPLWPAWSAFDTWLQPLGALERMVWLHTGAAVHRLGWPPTHSTYVHTV